MPVKVPDDVLKMTTRCPHTFSCFTSAQCGKHKMCEVDYIYGINVISLKDNNMHIVHSIKVWLQLLCSCPTHYAIKCMNQ